MIPEFTIGIPSYNRASQLKESLEQISMVIEETVSEFNVEIPVETLVILDGSNDGSELMLSEMSKCFPVPLRFLWQENKGLATTRNRLVESAVGEVVWLLDDDMLITKSALLCHMNAHDGHSVVFTGPFGVDGNKGIESFYEKRWEQLEGKKVILSPDEMSFANTSFKRNLLLKMRFNEEFKTYGFEDYELAVRMLQNGIRITFCKDAVVTHRYVKSVLNILKNNFQEGENRVLFSNLHPEYRGIAYNLKPKKYRSVLQTLSNLGMHRFLWFSAVSLYIINRASGRWNAKIADLSHDCALHGGFAKAGGKFH